MNKYLILAALGFGAAVVGVVYWKRKAIAEAVDITSPNNIAIKTSDALVEKLTGDKGTSTGSKAFDLMQWLNPFSANDNDITKPVTDEDIARYRNQKSAVSGADLSLMDDPGAAWSLGAGA